MVEPIVTATGASPCELQSQLPEAGYMGGIISDSIGLHRVYSFASKLLKWCYIGEYIGEYYRVIKGDTGSLD